MRDKYSLLLIGTAEMRLLPRHLYRFRIKDFRDFDNLSAVWIMSCNDENPIITFKGILFRLNLAEEADILEMVRCRNELFRPGVLQSRLDDWKQSMKQGHNLPTWLSSISNDTQRNAEIDKLTRSDVFRNQFRADEGAPKCSIEVIEWGLNHIERIRKSSVEDKEAKFRLVSTVIIPFLSVLAVLVSTIIVNLTQSISLREQAKIKQFESTTKPKQDAYAKFVTSLSEASSYAGLKQKDSAMTNLSQVNTSYHLISAYLDSESKKEVSKEIELFRKACIDSLGSTKKDASQDLLKQKDLIEETVFRKLFPES